MRKKIYIDSWLELKPYENQCPTDLYYLELCNAVHQAISKSELFHELIGNIDGDSIKQLACFLTSYFEDLVSDTNIWNTFVRLHNQLYQKSLPFYQTEDYVPEEINIQDVAFLIWYYMNTSVPEGRFINPYHPFIEDIAASVMDVFEAVWETAPDNADLSRFYQLDEKEEDYYTSRKLIDTILFETYLFYVDTRRTLDTNVHEIMLKGDEQSRTLALMNEERDRILNTTTTRLLSFHGKKWAAELLGASHPLSKAFETMSKKILAYFLYKGQDAENVFLEHIATGRKFNLTKKSFDYSVELVEEDMVLFMGLVKWRDEWWFSGVYFAAPFNADLVLKERNSIESRTAINFLDSNEKTTEMLEEQYQAFLDFNNDLPIAFMPMDKVNKFVKSFFDFSNDSLKLSKEERQASRDRMKKAGFRGEKLDLNFDDSFHSSSSPTLVYFNPLSGLEIGSNILNAFPMSSNPYITEDDSTMEVFGLLIDQAFSKELAMYCVDNFKDKLPFFVNGIGLGLLGDIDFLLRFWKRETYHTEPKLALV